jgi:hypothetical protein
MISDLNLALKRQLQLRVQELEVSVTASDTMHGGEFFLVV